MRNGRGAPNTELNTVRGEADLRIYPMLLLTVDFDPDVSSPAS
jgi:hypothetical protein